MTVATALIAGNEPQPQLAEEAVRQALGKLKAAGASHATSVLLYLTADFARTAQPAILAASRVAECTQVAGATANGLFTEDGWVLDRPAAAAMVFGNDLCLRPGQGPGPLLGFADSSALPAEWCGGPPRFGGLHCDSLARSSGPVWNQSRLCADHRLSLQVTGVQPHVETSLGLRLLGDPLAVTRVTGHDLQTLADQPALDTLLRCLPLELRERNPLPLHQITAVLTDAATSPAEALAGGRGRLVPLIAANNDHSLTLADRITPGLRLSWAIRQPVAAEQDMRASLERLAHRVREDSGASPAFALVFSCIGRGPYFYGGEDRDLACLTQHFPGLPILGLYGSSQILPQHDGGGRLVHNAVVTALYTVSGASHVQP